MMAQTSIFENIAEGLKSPHGQFLYLGPDSSVCGYPDPLGNPRRNDISRFGDRDDLRNIPTQPPGEESTLLICAVAMSALGRLQAPRDASATPSGEAQPQNE